MAKRASGSRSSKQRQREVITPTPSLAPLSDVSLVRAIAQQRIHQAELAAGRPDPILDRRRWLPPKYPRPVAARRKHRLIGLRVQSPLYGLHFRSPIRVQLCVRRRVRKEVLHAFRRIGKGKGSRRTKRRNEWSSIGC